jgi:hypothetical protein
MDDAANGDVTVSTIELVIMTKLPSSEVILGGQGTYRTVGKRPLLPSGDASATVRYLDEAGSSTPAGPTFTRCALFVRPIEADKRGEHDATIF